MDDLGTPVAYLALPPGVPVYDEHGARVGTVAQVLADEDEDIFHGLVVRTGAGGRPAFAGREQIAGLFQHGVTLTVPGSGLREPSRDAVAAQAVDEPAGGRARTGLRRAWDRLRRRF